MIKNIFFDLDGTINNSGIGIKKAIKYALKNFDIEIESEEFIKKYIGPPLLDCFMEFNGLSREDSEKALKYYRDYYNTIGKFEAEVYDGMIDLLKELKEKGANLYVATSKPEDVMYDVLTHFNLLQLFDAVYGASLDSTRNKKTAVIKYALETGGMERETSIMIGDHHHDVLGAKENGMKSVAVTYGYGDRLEIFNSNPDYTVSTVAQLRKLLLGLI